MCPKSVEQQPNQHSCEKSVTNLMWRLSEGHLSFCHQPSVALRILIYPPWVGWSCPGPPCATPPPCRHPWTRSKLSKCRSVALPPLERIKPVVDVDADHLHQTLFGLFFLSPVGSSEVGPVVSSSLPPPSLGRAPVIPVQLCLHPASAGSEQRV